MTQYYITIEFEIDAKDKDEAFTRATMYKSNKKNIRIDDLKSHRIMEIEVDAKKKYVDHCIDDAGWGIIGEVMDNLGTWHEYLILQGKEHKDCDECIDTKESLVDDGFTFD